jgi:hypothetical protein
MRSSNCCLLSHVEPEKKLRKALVNDNGRGEERQAGGAFSHLSGDGLEQIWRGIDDPKCRRVLTILEIPGRMHLPRMDHAEASSGYGVVGASIVIFPWKINTEAKLILVVHMFWECFRRARGVCIQLKEHVLT